MKLYLKPAGFDMVKHDADSPHWLPPVLTHTNQIAYAKPVINLKELQPFICQYEILERVTNYFLVKSLAVFLMSNVM